MSHVSLSEISTRRLPLGDRGLEQKSTSKENYELQFMGEDDQDFVIKEVLTADTFSF
jgi:hypothetical protein